jgi:hypothetical protein
MSPLVEEEPRSKYGEIPQLNRNFGDADHLGLEH